MPFSILKKLDQDIIKDNNSNIKSNIKDNNNNNTENYKYCMKEFNRYQTCIDENPQKECLDLLQLWIKCNEKPFPENK